MATFDLKSFSSALNETNEVQSGVDFTGKSLKLDTEKDAKDIIAAISACPDLYYLTLTGNTLGVTAAEAIAKALEAHPELKVARWSDIFTGRMKTEIPPALKALGDGMIAAGARLKVLDLSDNAFGPIGVEGLAKLLQSEVCSELEELRLNNNGLGITGARLLAKALSSRPPKLRVFIAGRNRLENDGATALAQVFEQMGSLEEVAMPQNGINHVGISALSQAFKQNPQLSCLNLNDNTIGPKGAAAMAEALPKLKNLKAINFGDCLLKSKGARTLAKAFKDNSTLLECLDLSHNEIGREACKELVDAITELPDSSERLSRVVLAGNRLDISRDQMSHGAMQDMVASLTCRTIRIGSYEYTPKEKVTMSSKGVKIVAPSLKDESREVALQIQLKDVVRLLVHFSKGVPVIFLYTLHNCGYYIRKALDMVDDTGPYYNPMSKIDPHRRITLLPDCISDEAKMAFKVLFGKTMDELTGREANDILVRTCTKEGNCVAKMTTRSSSVSSASGTKSSGPTEIRQILIYPPGKGGIPINTEDYMCLAQGQFLNDVIIDFYLKYLVHDVLTDSQRDKTHIFSTFFYKRLTTKPSKVNKSSNPHEWDNSLTAAQKRHLSVKTWTKNVNIFEKDFIVVPINENCHWFVAIICFPTVEGCRSMIDNRTVTPQEIKKRERRSSMQIGNTTTPLTKQKQLTLSCDSDNLSERDEAEAEESNIDMQCDSDEEEAEAAAEKKAEAAPTPKTEPIKQPCILIFDSLARASRSQVLATLRDYLTCEYQAKISPTKVFNKDNIKGSCPKIPQQNNFTDCGLYLLQYVEQFFKDPVKDYAIPIKQLSSWFDEIVVTRKREEISLLLKALMNRYNPDSHLALPDIAFPTLNGKLVETDEHEGESDADKANTSTSTSKILKAEVKETESGTTLTLVKQISSGDILLKPSFSGATDAPKKNHPNICRRRK